MLAGQYSIHFSRPEKPWPDLCEFGSRQIDAPSAFAALAAGVNSLRQLTPANPRVWASAVWDGEFKPVDFLPQKIEAARRWNAKAFYVAPSQPHVEDFQSPELEIKTLVTQMQPSPEHALSKYFADSFLEPESDDWEICRNYHTAVRLVDRKKANGFYDSRFFRLIIDRLRHNIWVSPTVQRPLEFTHLVTIATRQIEPVKTLVATLGIQHLLVLYTKGPSDLEREAEEICHQCESASPGLTAQYRGFSYNPESADFPREFSEGIREHVDTFIGEVLASKVVFDIDRGLTLHKVALTQRIVQSENAMVSLYHEMSAGNFVVHGTERIFAFNLHDNWDKTFQRLELKK